MPTLKHFVKNAYLKAIDSYLTCHLRHVGLKEAAPPAASSAVLQQNKACPLAFRAC